LENSSLRVLKRLKPIYTGAVNVFRLLGFVFLGVAALGVLVPLLPATPFVLLAAACFARSSEKWHQWMLRNETFGPMIRDWDRNRCISCRVKLIAIASMILVGGFSIFYAIDSVPMRIVGAVFILLGLVTVSIIKTCRT
jgi:uncharacterized membrane protein YbaN (DUF454 family)